MKGNRRPGRYDLYLHSSLPVPHHFSNKIGFILAHTKKKEKHVALKDGWAMLYRDLHSLAISDAHLKRERDELYQLFIDYHTLRSRCGSVLVERQSSSEVKQSKKIVALHKKYSQFEAVVLNKINNGEPHFLSDEAASEMIEEMHQQYIPQTGYRLFLLYMHQKPLCISLDKPEKLKVIVDYIAAISMGGLGVQEEWRRLVGGLIDMAEADRNIIESNNLAASEKNRQIFVLWLNYHRIKMACEPQSHSALVMQYEKFYKDNFSSDQRLDCVNQAEMVELLHGKELFSDVASAAILEQLEAFKGKQWFSLFQRGVQRYCDFWSQPQEKISRVEMQNHTVFYGKNT